LKETWSPQQISGHLSVNKQPGVSHESIYQYISATDTKLLWRSFNCIINRLHFRLESALDQYRAQLFAALLAKLLAQQHTGNRFSVTITLSKAICRVSWRFHATKRLSYDIPRP
jgi:hypothetical protein